MGNNGISEVLEGLHYKFRSDEAVHEAVQIIGLMQGF